ncbi:MAG TPA: ATP-binding protein, partial [Nitrospiria bacterium]|nr:ATP-binding protein [Nitrospiria bacterium]
GIGIPKEHLGKIFERFSQVDASASRQHEGTGIGLALVKELVELHHGQVKAESEPGRGTVMTVTLPMDLKEAEEKEALTPAQIERRAENRRRTEGRREDDWTKTLHHAAEYSAMDIGSDSPQMSPAETSGETIDAPRSTSIHRVLVVEDNADMRNFVAFQLKDDYVVLTARDGFEGVKAAKLTVPDLIVSDVMMPGKDGYQLCQEIKADAKTKHIPVILLTARAELSEKISGLERGADDYLTKPFNTQELKAKIKSLISLRGLEREIQSRSVELEGALKELQETQAQLVHSAKMASVGYLVAGVAHEINNPISFAKGSINSLKRCLDEVKGNIKDPEALQDMEKAITIIRTGLERTEQIVWDLKNFARKDETFFKAHDLHEGLDATLNLLSSSMEDRITVHKEYGPIGPVEMVAGQINQVFMNLLQNSIQSIADRGDIWIRTEKVNSPSGDEVIISVKDNGAGIKAEHLEKIFDPFFTTKQVGKGMGLGLSISYKIIETHGGTMEAKSQEGHGTEMIIHLPVMQQRS